MAELTGMETVLRNFNKEIEGIKGRSMKGIIRATIIFRRSMDKNAPKIPLDTANLRSSYFTVTSDGNTEEGATAVFRDDKKAKSSGLQGTAASMAARHVAVITREKMAIAGSQNLYVVFGFTAFYAWFVHEMMGKDSGINWSRPGSGPKYAEAALKREKQAMFDVIAKEAKIK